MLGFETGLHRTFIAHVERRARNISIDNLEKIAIALEVPAHRLLEPYQDEHLKGALAP
jgi:transcriptional regulator with XRE-family HTH domain